MKKTMIMSAAVITSLFFGEALMAGVFGFVMLSGLMAGCFMNESARQVVECPALVFRPAGKKIRTGPSA
jgi:hypothetical protein